MKKRLIVFEGTKEQLKDFVAMAAIMKKHYGIDVLKSFDTNAKELQKLGLTIVEDNNNG